MNLLRMTPEHACTPAEDASAIQLLALAEEYHVAALQLLSNDITRPGASRTPYRLLVLHGVELYLGAYLTARGQETGAIEHLNPDLEACLRSCQKAGLGLHTEAQAELLSLARRQEQQATGHGAQTAELRTEQVNRIWSALEDMAGKVRYAVRKDV